MSRCYIMWAILGTFSITSAKQTANDIAAALEQLASQTYSARPMVAEFTQSNLESTLIGQGPVVVRFRSQDAVTLKP